MAWFYCDGRTADVRKGQQRYIFGSIYRQLITALVQGRLPKMVEHLEGIQAEVRKTSTSKIGQLFATNIVYICGAYGKELNVMVDGLDESPEAGNISEQLRAMAYRQPQVVKVLICSRHEQEILTQLTNELPLQITTSSVANDIKRHIASRFNSERKLYIIKPSTQQEITGQLLDKHGGSYSHHLATLAADCSQGLRGCSVN